MCSRLAFKEGLGTGKKPHVWTIFPHRRFFLAHSPWLNLVWIVVFLSWGVVLQVGWKVCLMGFGKDLIVQT